MIDQAMFQSVASKLKELDWGDRVSFWKNSCTDEKFAISITHPNPNRSEMAHYVRELREVWAAIGGLGANDTPYNLAVMLEKGYEQNPIRMPGERDKWAKIEDCSNPIFLLEKRVLEEACLPDWVERIDCDYLMINPEYIPVWVDQSSLKGIYNPDEGNVVEDEDRLWEILSDPETCGGDCVHAVETWKSVSLFYSRIEGEIYAKDNGHKFTSGWRVKCISAQGSLEEILKVNFFNTL